MNRQELKEWICQCQDDNHIKSILTEMRADCVNLIWDSHLNPQKNLDCVDNEMGRLDSNEYKRFLLC